MATAFAAAERWQQDLGTRPKARSCDALDPVFTRWHICPEVGIRKADLRMKSRLSVAFVTALCAAWMAAALPSDARSCRHNRSHECLKLPATLDFSSVRDISNGIAGDQPPSRTRRNRAIDPQPTANPYTGPMIGNSRVGVPTVGYYWSIN
jgi:hypothetical protein